MEFGALPFTARQLQYVVAVAEVRSFRAAAEICLVSQPALSAQVAELESVIGARLFERGRRGVLLTPAGERLVESARRVLLELESFRRSAEGLGDPLEGPLRLGVIPTVAPYLLPDLDPALRTAFPRLNPVWREDKTENVVQSLTSGDLDAAVVALEADLGRSDYEVIGIDPFVLATSVDHPLSRRKTRAAEADLEGENVLLLDDGHCLRDQALEWCGSAGTHELGFRATSLATLCQMVAGGAGVTLLPKLAVSVEGRDKKLAVREFKRPAPKRTIVLIWRHGSPLASALRELVKTAKKSFPLRP